MHFEWVQPTGGGGGGPAAACTAIFAWRDRQALLQLQPLAQAQAQAQRSQQPQRSQQQQQGALPAQQATPLATGSSAAPPAQEALRRTVGPPPPAAGAKGGAAAAAAAAALAAAPQEQQPVRLAAPGARAWVLPRPITSSAVSSKAGLLATGHDDGSILIWDARLGACVSELARGSAPVAGLSFVPESASGDQQQGCCLRAPAALAVALLAVDAAGGLALHRQVAGAGAGVLERAWEVLAWGASAGLLHAPHRHTGTSSQGGGLLLGSVRRVVCAAAPGLALLLLQRGGQGRPGLLWLDVQRLQPLASLALPSAGLSEGLLLEPGAVALVAGRVLVAASQGSTASGAVGRAAGFAPDSDAAGGGCSSPGMLMDFGPVDDMVERMLAAAAPELSSAAGGAVHIAAQLQPATSQLAQLVSLLASKGRPQSSSQQRAKPSPAPSPGAVPAAVVLHSAPLPLQAAGYLANGSSSRAAGDLQDAVARAMARLQGSCSAALDEAHRQSQLKLATAAVARKMAAAESAADIAGAASSKPLLGRLLMTSRSLHKPP
jgi:hypothetical protein